MTTNRNAGGRRSGPTVHSIMIEELNNKINNSDATRLIDLVWISVQHRVRGQVYWPMSAEVGHVWSGGTPIELVRTNYQPKLSPFIPTV